jgi:hypothetical protein
VRHFALTILALALLGCSSPPRAEAPERASGAAVVVVGWSLRDQAPIPVRGLVRQGRTEVQAFDTRGTPDGKTLSLPSAGSYEVEVTHRYAGAREIASTGLERIDVRPGETVRCEVVVDDREGEAAH